MFLFRTHLDNAEKTTNTNMYLYPSIRSKSGIVTNGIRYVSRVCPFICPTVRTTRVQILDEILIQSG